MLQLRRSRRRDAPPAQIVTTARVAAARRRAALLRLVKASPFPPTLYCCSSGFVLQQCCSLQAHLPALATRLLRSYSLAAQLQPSSVATAQQLGKRNAKVKDQPILFIDKVELQAIPSITIFLGLSSLASKVSQSPATKRLSSAHPLFEKSDFDRAPHLD